LRPLAFIDTSSMKLLLAICTGCSVAARASRSTISRSSARRSRSASAPGVSSLISSIALRIRSACWFISRAALSTSPRPRASVASRLATVASARSLAVVTVGSGMRRPASSPGTTLTAIGHTIDSAVRLGRDT
jgi:hypothetical protein